MDNIALLILGIFISVTWNREYDWEISAQYIPTTEERSRKKMYRSMGEPSAQVRLSSVYL